ncbi:patatin-like phospholipase family protein [soil metagenome]
MTDAPHRLFQRGKRRLAEDPGQPVGFEAVRLTTREAAHGLSAVVDRIALPRAPWSREPFNVLAISGGAAGGAYGAGLLVGLGKADRRPEFALVTGVSTGALIAPFAFLGAGWDDRLRDAYTGGHAADVFALRRAAPGLEPGLFRARALDSLIAPFIDEAVLDAVADAHARGRRLFVATTDLDRQRACIWDMGAIASQRETAGPGEAVRLFREVLAASSSLPGVFPPRLIPCVSGDETYDEMHVDGGVAAPLFVLPDALLRWKESGRRMRGGRVYIIANTVLDPAPLATPANLPAILVRSFDTMLRFSYRQAISVTATFCAGAGLPLDIASIPYDPGHGSMMNFDTASMTRMFEAASRRAEHEEVWTPGSAEPDAVAGLFARTFNPGDKI